MIILNFPITTTQLHNPEVELLIEGSIGMLLFIVFVALGIGNILTGISIWYYLKIQEGKPEKPNRGNPNNQNKHKQKNESQSKE